MDIPGYELLDLLGQGGFGTVHRAWQSAVRREVALKIDSRVLTTDRDRRRFMREVTAAGQLSGHPHVAGLYDAGVLPDGRPYMVLELCPGGSLSDRLAETGPFPVAEVRDIGVRIADALAAAHAAGVLHRDVKPANILVNRYGGVALADFGLAAMPMPGFESSATREALTPAYAPPEAFRQENPTPAGDVYSLAASLYALLSGRPPYYPPDGRPSIVALMAARSGPPPELPGVPPALSELLRQAMACDPADRIPGAAAFRDALARLDLGAASAPAPASAPSIPGVPRHSVAGLSTGPAFAGPTGPVASKGRRPAAGYLVAAGAIAVALLAAGLLIALTRPGGAGSQGAQGTDAGNRGGGGSTAAASANPFSAVETTTGACAAAAIADARARCMRRAECWGGIVSNAGDSHANQYDCRQVHTWETFAIAVLPPTAQTWNAHEVSSHPTVRKVCSLAVLRRSLLSTGGTGRTSGTGSSADWSADVLPPSSDQYAKGARLYRCVASRGLDGLRGAYFRPLD